MSLPKSIFGDSFAAALKQQVTEDSVAFMPEERDSTFRGNIGWATASNRFRLYTASDLQSYELEVTMDEGDDSYTGAVRWNGADYRITTTMAGGTFVWFEDVNIAGTMREHIVDKDGSAWVFSERELAMPVEKIIYWGSEKFRDIVTERGGALTSTVGITGMSNWKKNFRNFVAMHLFYLPSAVAAVAKWGQRNGMTDVSVNIDDIWSLSPVFSAAQYDDDGGMFFTEEAQREIVGDEDGFMQSTMFQQRAALWELLGEENPLAYLPDKVTGKYAMKSESLRWVINTVMGEWLKPALLAVTNVSLPIFNLTDNQGRPVRQDVIVDWFNTEEQAKAFIAASDLVVPKNSNSTLPAAWQNMEVEWRTAITDVKKRYDTPESVDAGTLDLLEASVTDLQAWWN